jgi:hypothetical protein
MNSLHFIAYMCLGLSAVIYYAPRHFPEDGVITTALFGGGILALIAAEVVRNLKGKR